MSAENIVYDVGPIQEIPAIMSMQEKPKIVQDNGS